MADLKTVSVVGAALDGGDIEMEYATFGSGSKPFVIIPGLSLRSTLASASSVETAYKVFKDDYTVYLFDRRKNMPEVYSVKEMAHDLAATLKAIGIEHASVLGTSQGGMIAQYMAINNPELVGQLVLASSSSKAEPLQVAVIGNWAKLAREGKTEELVNDFIDNAFTPAFLQRYRRALLMMYKNLTAEELHRFAITAEACAGVDTYDNLGKIQCPTLVIGAGLDHVVTYEASVKIAEKLKSENVPYQFYTYEENGHAVFDEAKDYKERVLEFFRTH
ncbi:alpha/beta fold hydrolase [Fibrobacter sp. UWEL]|uniref:alpha/beta fold hydrolase n=1 Tax=Fibrobacter sp. UWEL TaxID=1896209 RepID=UPI00091418C1|nr:alpha/beta hydrolase [Fibrobacter sp. UWEL]SHK90881.1 Pimeloyl-ACP methyl ester carboxylesterase [Fibrobacter sp. UWEL]